MGISPRRLTQCDWRIVGGQRRLHAASHGSPLQRLEYWKQTRRSSPNGKAIADSFPGRISQTPLLGRVSALRGVVKSASVLNSDARQRDDAPYRDAQQQERHHDQTDPNPMRPKSLADRGEQQYRRQYHGDPNVLLRP